MQNVLVNKVLVNNKDQKVVLPWPLAPNFASKKHKEQEAKEFNMLHILRKVLFREKSVLQKRVESLIKLLNQLKSFYASRKQYKKEAFSPRSIL